MPHRFALRVYYEDTDLGQVVYYANYLRFIERARTEMLSDAGINQVRLLADEGLVFVVRRVEADYLRPARFDDRLEVETAVTSAAGSRIVMVQTVRRGAETLFVATVTVVCVALDAMRPARLPPPILAALEPTP